MPGKYLGGPYSQLSHPHQLTARRMRPPQHRNTMPPSGHHHHVAGTAALTWWYELYAAHVATSIVWLSCLAFQQSYYTLLHTQQHEHNTTTPQAAQLLSKGAAAHCNRTCICWPFIHLCCTSLTKTNHLACSPGQTQQNPAVSSTADTVTHTDPVCEVGTPRQPSPLTQKEIHCKSHLHTLLMHSGATNLFHACCVCLHGVERTVAAPGKHSGLLTVKSTDKSIALL